MTFAYTWSPPTAPGVSSPFILCYASVFVRTNYFNGLDSTHYHELSQSFTMLQSVVLPDGTYWAFQYDAADPNPNNTASIALADLTRITLPIGGSLSYTYDAKTGATTGNREVRTRTVDANDGTDPHIWHYSYLAQAPVNGNLTQNTIVQDPLNNETVHVMTGLGGMFALYETQTQYFQGSHSGGSLLKTVTTDYQFTPNPWDLGMQSVTNVFPIRVTTTLPGGQVSKVETDYETALTYHGPLDNIQITQCSQFPFCFQINCNTSNTGVSNYTGSYGKAIATREYDYGASLPVRQTATAYQWQSGTNAAFYLANNFLDLVSSVTTRDGAGNQVAQSTYGYDENTLGSSKCSSLYLNRALPQTVRFAATALPSINGSIAPIPRSTAA